MLNIKFSKVASRHLNISLPSKSQKSIKVDIVQPKIPDFYEKLKTMEIDNFESVSDSHICKLINNLSSRRSDHVLSIMLIYSKMNLSKYLGKENIGERGIIFTIEDIPRELITLIGKYSLCKEIDDEDLSLEN